MPLIPRARSLPVRGRAVAPAEVRGFSSDGALFSISSTAPSGGGTAGGGRWSAAEATAEAYYANVIVYGCVKAIATDLGGRPFRVGADPDKPNDFDPKHPLAQRLGPAPGGPNPHTSPRRLWRWAVAQRLITGAYAWEIAPSDLTFWPLLTRYLKPIESDGRAPSRGYFSGYEYHPEGGDKVNLSADRVFYDWEPSQDDWRKPESPLQAARLDVSVAVMQDRYDFAFLKNDARPAALVVHEAFANDIDKRKFRRQWLDTHRGPENAGKVHFLETSPHGATPKDSLAIQVLGLSQKDAEFIRRYESKIRAITVAFGVPMSRLGDASERTFSNADRETFNYWLDTVQPMGSDFADAVNMRLMPLFDSSGNVGFFDWSGVPDLEPLRRFAVGDVPNLVNSGIITLNEGREALDLSPVDGGDELDDGPDPIVTPPEPEDEPADDDENDDDEPAAPITESALSDALKPIQGALTALRRDVASLVVGDTPEGDDAEAAIRAAKERRARIWRSVDRQAVRLERIFKRQMEQYFADQRKSIVNRLEGKRGRQMLRAPEDGLTPDAVMDVEYWRANLSRIAQALYSAVTSQSFTAAEAFLDVAFDLDAPFAQAFILDRANNLAGQVTSTTYDAIKQALAEGAVNGESIPDLAKRIDGLFGTTWANRAETVARTEVISAYNGSSFLAYQEAGDVVGGIEWVSTLDDRTRPEHAEMDGTVIGPGEAFELDGATLLYPGDPDVSTRYDSSGNIPDPGSVIINCRCTIAPVLAEEMPTRERAVPRAQVERALVLLARGDLDLRSAVQRLDETLT